jgi:hypothetical protein
MSHKSSLDLGIFFSLSATYPTILAEQGYSQDKKEGKQCSSETYHQEEKKEQ